MDTHSSSAKVEFRPVYEHGWQVTPDEVPQLYDIFIDGQWHGSRRTIKQCEEQVRNAR